MSQATKYGDAWVAQVYLIRHLIHGVLTDCSYAERPSDHEVEAVCTSHGLPYRADLIRIVELPVVTGLAHRAESLSDLDAWTPPPPPVISVAVGQLSAEVDPENEANILNFKVKISGAGRVGLPPEEAPSVGA